MFCEEGTWPSLYMVEQSNSSDLDDSNTKPGWKAPGVKWGSEKGVVKGARGWGAGGEVESAGKEWKRGAEDIPGGTDML